MMKFFFPFSILLMKAFGICNRGKRQWVCLSLFSLFILVCFMGFVCFPLFRHGIANIRYSRFESDRPHWARGGFSHLPPPEHGMMSGNMI